MPFRLFFVSVWAVSVWVKPDLRLKYKKTAGYEIGKTYDLVRTRFACRRTREKNSCSGDSPCKLPPNLCMIVANLENAAGDLPKCLIPDAEDKPLIQAKIIHNLWNYG